MAPLSSLKNQAITDTAFTTPVVRHLTTIARQVGERNELRQSLITPEFVASLTVNDLLTDGELQNAMIQTDIDILTDPEVMEMAIRGLDTTWIDEQLDTKIGEDASGNDITFRNKDENVITSVNSPSTHQRLAIQAGTAKDGVGMGASAMKTMMICHTFDLYLSKNFTNGHTETFREERSSSDASQGLVTYQEVPLVFTEMRNGKRVYLTHEEGSEWLGAKDNNGMNPHSTYGLSYRDSAGELEIYRPHDPTKGRFRLGLNYYIDRNGNRQLVKTPAENAIQAALDNQKDPKLDKTAIKRETMAAFTLMNLAGYADYAVPFFNHPAVQHVMGRIGRGHSKTRIVKDILADLGMTGLGKIKTLDEALMVAHTLFFADQEVLTYDEMNADIVEHRGEPVNDLLNQFPPHSAEYMRHAFMAIRFLAYNNYGSQLTTTTLALNNESKKLPSNLMGNYEQVVKYENMFKVRLLQDSSGNAKPVFISPVGNIGGINRIDRKYRDQLPSPQQVSSGEVTIEGDVDVVPNRFTTFNMGQDLVMHMFRESTMGASYEVSHPMLFMSSWLSLVSTHTLNDSSRLATRFLLKSELLYKNMLANSHAEEMGISEYRDTLLHDILEDGEILSESLAKRFRNIKNDPKYAPYRENAVFRYMNYVVQPAERGTGLANDTPDLLTYNRYANFTEREDIAVARGIMEMVNSTDADIHQLGLDMVMYPLITNGLNHSLSYLQHIPYDMLLRVMSNNNGIYNRGMGKVLHSMMSAFIGDFNNTSNKDFADSALMDATVSLMVQTAQMYPEAIASRLPAYNVEFLDENGQVLKSARVGGFENPVKHYTMVEGYDELIPNTRSIRIKDTGKEKSTDLFLSYENAGGRDVFVRTGNDTFTLLPQVNHRYPGSIDLYDPSKGYLEARSPVTLESYNPIPPASFTIIKNFLSTKRSITRDGVDLTATSFTPNEVGRTSANPNVQGGQSQGSSTRQDMKKSAVDMSSATPVSLSSKITDTLSAIRDEGLFADQDERRFLHALLTTSQQFSAVRDGVFTNLLDPTVTGFLGTHQTDQVSRIQIAVPRVQHMASLTNEPAKELYVKTLAHEVAHGVTAYAINNVYAAWQGKGMEDDGTGKRRPFYEGRTDTLNRNHSEYRRLVEAGMTDDTIRATIRMITVAIETRQRLLKHLSGTPTERILKDIQDIFTRQARTDAERLLVSQNRHLLPLVKRQGDDTLRQVHEMVAVFMESKDMRALIGEMQRGGKTGLLKSILDFFQSILNMLGLDTKDAAFINSKFHTTLSENSFIERMLFSDYLTLVDAGPVNMKTLNTPNGTQTSSEGTTMVNDTMSGTPNDGFASRTTQLSFREGTCS